METVLAADVSTDFGRQSLWRQLVDLIGRRRVSPTEEAISKLHEIRDQVPAAVRAASARALEHANPPRALVMLFAGDALNVALPVLRSARLTSEEWIALLPTLTPPARSILRNRRDLGPKVRRALESFGASDFVLGDESAEALVRGDASAASESEEIAEEVAPIAEGPRSPFQPFGDVTRGLPFVNEAMRTARRDKRAGNDTTSDAPNEGGKEERGPFRIADVVARIEAYRRERDEGKHDTRRPVPQAAHFRFECDASGLVRWVDGVEREAMIGLSLVQPGTDGVSRADATAAGAFRRRSAFTDARLIVEGRSSAAGDWLISAKPLFDPRSGRFVGFRGTARRPRADERAEPRRTRAAAQSLRQLVHELRTPAGAISGFAEMIEGQLFGSVPAPYREQAADIRDEAKKLLGVIDDLDLAARIEDESLDLHGGNVALQPLFDRIADDLQPLVELRGTELVLPATDCSVAGDGRAVERLLARLLATLVSAAGKDDRIEAEIGEDREEQVVMTFTRPSALPPLGAADDEECEDRAMLGTGFSLRLARNLAREMGGDLGFSSKCLTLRLPAAEDRGVDQAQTN
ncbi:HAMP domain-containing sensor histidine kinase [Stakelama marina]|nr:HAMP domain-containing sensor histidine kinase [Stakelama marina]